MGGLHVTAPRWAWREWGRPGAPSLVLLHGFTGSAAFWEPLARRWAAHWRVLAPDLPGHGGSDAPPAGYDLACAADDVAAALDGPATVVGYSLGGRLALHLATRHPERVSRLVLIGASAGLAEASARAERREADARWAAMLRGEGLEAFLDAWEALPLFAGHAQQPPERQAWLRGLRAGQSAEGLARSLEAFGLGAQADLAPGLAALAVPTWWVVGERDVKFRAIAAELAGRMPDARQACVPGAGHNVPFERPEPLLALVDSLFPLSIDRV